MRRRASGVIACPRPMSSRAARERRRGAGRAPASREPVTAAGDARVVDEDARADDACVDEDARADEAEAPPSDPAPPSSRESESEPATDRDADPDPAPASRFWERPIATALAIYAVVTLVYFVTMAPERRTAHTPFNHFALLAEAWLKGRLDLGGPPPEHTGNNDFAVVGGRWFVSFPPFPAALILPVVALVGSAARVRDGLFFLLLAGVAPAVLFLALDALSRAGRSPRSRVDNVALALAFALGSVYWFSAVQGTVWFAAHVVGAALASTYLYASIGAAYPVVAGLALGLAFATRTPLGFAFPFFAFEAARASLRPPSNGDPGDASRPALRDLWARLDRGALARRLVAFGAPAAALLALLLWHNHARFGDPLEFGHRLLAIVWRPRIEKWGLFSYHYLGRNLAVVLTSLPYLGTAGVPFQINGHGLALWVTTPLYAWAVWPKRTSPTFWALAVTAAAVAAPSLLYQNTGWIQFGYRFSNDFAPFLFALVALSGRRFGPPFWLLFAFAVAVNAFGAVTFQRAGFEKYYFLERTQRILHQPD